MGYQSRKRGYKSRRERMHQHKRVIRMVTIFLFLAILLWLYKEREEWWWWIKTYFY